MTEQQQPQQDNTHNPIVFSGIQPTGIIHIGNYLGAIRNWAQMLDDYDCIFCIVDLHAMTVPYDADGMQGCIRDALIVNMAAGLDPERCTIFVQSHVPQHTELTWILSTCTGYGDLTRMTQFKEKSEQHRDFVNAGLFTYPILMAADILLYKASVVPVGDDQIQHLELTREICRNFNKRFGDTFPEPRPRLSEQGELSRIRGLDDKAKMSKSQGNYIPLIVEKEELWDMLRPAATDPARVRRDDPGTPEICNIHRIHLGFSPPEDIEWCEEGCRTAGIGCIDCKRRLTENMEKNIAPLREKYHYYRENPDYVDDVIRTGAQNCRRRAEETMAEVRRRVGIR